MSKGAIRQLAASFDIETTGLDADYDTILCAVVKPWMGNPIVFREDKYKRPRRSENPEMVRSIIEELNKYNTLIAHNGVRFDRPYLNTLALQYGLDVVLKPFGNIIDPVLIARKALKFSSNSLWTLSEFLETETRKTRVSGKLWRRATIDNDKQALKEIIEHCIHDVLVLEEVTWKMREFIRRINDWGSA